MKKILLGLALVFLELRVGGVNYLPHWLGYALVCWGLATAGADNAGRVPALAVGVASAVLSGALWVAGVLGYGMTFPLDELLQLLVTYRLLVWCGQMETLEGSYLLSRFRMTWYALLGARLAAFVLGVFLPPLGWIWSLVAFVVGLVYLYTLYRLQRTLPPQARRG